MGYEHNDLSFLPAIRWGNKDVAQYINEMSQAHIDFTCTVPGLIINSSYPYLGASPDGLINCKCCGEGLLEIKCLFSIKHHPARQPEKVTFLLASGKLKWSHKYYTQVQGQLNIADKLYCDFLFGHQKVTW